MASTSELIDAARASDQAKAETAQGLAAAVTSDTAAATDQAAKHGAVFTDLTTNGQALYMDQTTDPPAYMIAAPVPPADFSLTPIRLA